MSLEEMEDTWSNQSVPPSRNVEPVKKAADSLNNTLLLSWGMLSVVVFAFALKVHKIWTEPAHTFANSFWDLSIAAAGVACGVFGVIWARKFVHEFRALGQDTVRCLDHLIYSVEWEIRSIRRDTPIMMLIFFVLFLLAKHQSITSGLEDAFEWNLIPFVLGIFGIAGAVLYHRVRAFLQPRLTELRAVRSQFETTA